MGELLRNLTSRDAWYLGHASPDELEHAFIQEEVDAAWEHHQMVEQSDLRVAEREAVREVKEYCKTKFDRVDVSRTNGASPIPEPHSIRYLDSILMECKELFN